MPESERPLILPAHIDDTVRAIARLHAEHHGQATTAQRIVGGLTARAGRPGTLMALSALTVGWVAANIGVTALGFKAWDEPPFSWLQGATGVAALLMTILILATQKRDDRLASHREQLMLELGILGEPNVTPPTRRPRTASSPSLEDLYHALLPHHASDPRPGTPIRGPRGDRRRQSCAA